MKGECRVRNKRGQLKCWPASPVPTTEMLHGCGVSNYREYLASPHWKDVRRRYRTSKKPQGCAVCGERWSELHHRTYRRLGRERLSDLVPLCRQHHEAAHKAQRSSNDWTLWDSTRDYIAQAKRQVELTRQDRLSRTRVPVPARS